MRLYAFAVLALLCACTPLQTQAQDYLYQTGTPTFTTQVPIEKGFVQVNNGDIHIEIPIASTPQRGGVLAANQRLVYDSRIWKITDNGSYQWSPTNVPNSAGGWLFLSGGGGGTVSYTVNGGTDHSPPGCSEYPLTAQYTEWSTWRWTDPTGTTHTFPRADTVQYGPPSETYGNCTAQNMPQYPTSSSDASDGSGYVISVTNYNQATVTSKDGVTYYPGTANQSDYNGNQLSADANGNLIDTNNLTPVVATTSGNLTTYGVLPVGGGTRNNVTVTWETVPYSTKFGESAVAESSGSISVIKSVGLPDGTSYQFTYDPNYGDLIGMTLPTGGTVSYKYTNFFDSFKNYNRWVYTVTEAGGTTTFFPTTLSYCTSSQGCSETVKVTTPDNNDTLYAFNLDKAGQLGGRSWHQTTTAYNGLASAGQALRSETSNYTYYTGTGFIWKTYPYQGGSAGFSAYGTYSEATSETDLTGLLDVSLQAQTATTFASGPFGYTPDPADTKEYDWYPLSSSTPSTLLRETVYSYGSTCDKLTGVVVKDGAGNSASQVTYNFDENTPIATSGLPQHAGTVNSSGYRCNVTSTHTWVNTNDSTLTTKTAYDDAGQVRSTTDEAGFTTTYGYDATDTNLASKTAPPRVKGNVLMQWRWSHDASTGALTSVTDPNSQQTSYSAFDVFNRPQQITAADGGVTNISYAPTSVTSSVPFNPSSKGQAITKYDTYGRVSQQLVANGQGSSTYYETDICYDINGRENFRSYPYASSGSGSPVCSGTGDSYLYEALGRVKSVTHGDGKSVSYAYTGRAVQAVDENGVSRVSQADALGRRTLVCEVSTNAVQGAQPSSCGTDQTSGGTSLTGYLTTFAYNLQQHLTTISQGSERRQFQTDSVGREYFTLEPERGSTQYGYSYNSTGLSVTRTRGAANVLTSVAAQTTITTVQYDSLGRPISTVYSDGTPSRIYEYDSVSTGWAQNQTNLVGRMSDYLVTGSSATIFSYDPVGRISFTGQCVPSGCSSRANDKYTNYSYDYQGNTTQISGTGVPTLSYTYSLANEMTSLTSSQSDTRHKPSILSGVQNGPYGPLTYSFGNGLTGVRGYDLQGRLNSLSVCAQTTSVNCSGGTQLYNNTVTFSGVRVSSLCDTVTGSCLTLGYDDLNRLSSANSSSGAALAANWTYDRYGNRWSQSVSQGGTNTSLSFNSNNQIVGDTYDQAGNLVNDGVHSYTYDAEGNITQVDGGSTSRYTYDAGNHRIREDVGSSFYEFLLNNAGQVASVWNGAPSNALVDQNMYWDRNVIAYSGSFETQWAYQDYIGTERMVRSYTGALDATFSSLPYGDSAQTSGTDAEPFHFAGLDRDPQSNLDSAQFRSYGSSQGRWYSPDPLEDSLNPSDPQSFNRYSYASGSPLSYADPLGLYTLPPNQPQSCSICQFFANIGQGIEAFFTGGSGRHVVIAPRPGTAVFVTASQQGATTMNDGTLTYNQSVYGTNLVIPKGGFTYGGTLEQFLSAAAAAGFYESRADYLTGIHQGVQLRSNNNFCNQHVTDVQAGSDSRGPIVTGNSHYDLVNPAPMKPDYIFFYPRLLAHGVLDFGVDKISEKVGSSFTLGNTLCSQ